MEKEMDTFEEERTEPEDFEDFAYVPQNRVRCHTVTVSQPSRLEKKSYYRKKARLAAARIPSQPEQSNSLTVRSRTSSFRSYFLPAVKTVPSMESTEDFWNRYRRQSKNSSLYSVIKLLFP